MTITVPAELEQRLAAEAERRGVSVDQYALQVLERSLAVESGSKALLELLQGWIAEGETGEPNAEIDLPPMLDADRLSDRKLFPTELKGITW